MIRLEKIVKRYGEVEALGLVDLEIRPGESLGIFGHNGSGKTTLLRILVGLSRPSSGTLLFDGSPQRGANGTTYPGKESWRAFHRRLGFMPERIAFHENLTGEQTLAHFARLRGAPRRQALEMLERVGLGEAAKRKLGGYSKGMLQRVNLAQALLGDPRVLILDEPLEGLDPHGVRLFFELLETAGFLGSCPEEGGERTLVVASHRLLKLSDAARRICILSAGKVRALGTAEELRRDAELPVRLIIHPRTDCNGAIESALGELSPASVERDGERLVASVSQAQKMTFISQLNGLGDAILDLRIKEPTLEEVYFEME
ncbi:MAG: ABC transporter ATP-binding protein [bacterium]|nr:ABC transporter ATP-binding protein [bacterium]